MNPYGVPEISVQDLKKQMDEGKTPLLLDVREQNEWDYVHIEDATLAPLSELAQQGPAAIPPELTADTEAVIYCHHGSRSAQVTAWLGQQGYSKVKSLKGGIDQWAAHVDRTLPRY